jgi:UDP-glucose 4-epimerase
MSTFLAIVQLPSFTPNMATPVLDSNGASPSLLRVLVTGSSGYLGRSLCAELKALGHFVVGLDVLPGQHTDVQGSSGDRLLIRSLFAQHSFTAVCNAGALHKPDIARGHSYAAFVEVNVTGTLNLLEAAAAVKPTPARFVHTSTTSVMISQALHASDTRVSNETIPSVWMDESFCPLEPRNIYGVTKLSAEGLCRMYAYEHSVPCIVLRTSRFFPEEDDADDGSISELNQKTNEFLNRRLTVQDAVRAHILALQQTPEVKFDILIISAPTPFQREDVEELGRNASSVIARRCGSDIPDLYTSIGWKLPSRIGRVYDSSRAERVLGFRCQTDYSAILNTLRHIRTSPLQDGSSNITSHILPFHPPAGTTEAERANTAIRSPKTSEVAAS